jgi:hypothetical protein
MATLSIPVAGELSRMPRNCEAKALPRILVEGPEDEGLSQVNLR